METKQKPERFEAGPLIKDSDSGIYNPVPFEIEIAVALETISAQIDYLIGLNIEQQHERDLADALAWRGNCVGKESSSVTGKEPDHE
jgi:hypothetical protein